MAAAAVIEGKQVCAKGKCCKDSPRCKKCPVVLKRMEAAGMAERLDKRHYVVSLDVKKSAVKALRKR